MDQNSLCRCHCGTRITVDEQLLEERETWKEKYLCLQKQAVNDIGRLKENIYAECASLMQKEFSAREAEQSQIVNDRNEQIKNLTARIINLEAKIKISDKENEILRLKCKELEGQVNDRDNTLQGIRSRGNKSQRDWEVRLEEEVTAIRKRISQQHQEELQKLEAENEHLRHKVKEFEKKFQAIIPEVQKLKQNLTVKNEQVELIEAKLDKLKKESQQQILRAKQETEEIEKLHSGCKGKIAKFSQKVESLTQELENNKKQKRQVRVEPVYIQRPVQVQKIVEKIVQVEKVITKYIEPTTFRDEQLEKQIQKLKEQNSQLIRQLQIFDQRNRSSTQSYEDCIRQHEENVAKYKKERQALVRTIEEQHKELDAIHLFLERKKQQSRPSEPQKIIVHVSKDGTYQKTVERVASPSVGISRQTNNRNSKKR